MDGLTAAWLVFILLFGLLFIRVPVAIALMGSGLVGLFLLDGVGGLGQIIQITPFNDVAKYSWTVIPMFVLMGALATTSGLVRSLFRLADKGLGRVPGGVGLAAVAACAGFAAVSGSSVATAASIGPIAGREMQKSGYRGSFAAGLVASAGTLGILIPPSLVLVVYGITTGESIGRLLIAAIFPGVVSALVIGAAVVLLRILRPRTVMTDEWLSLHAEEKPSRVNDNGDVGISALRSSSPVSVTVVSSAGSARESIPETNSEDGVHHSGAGAVLRIALLFGAVMGGLYWGFVTVTEAAALGAFVALIFAIFDLRKLGVVKVSGAVKSAALDSASTTGMLFLIIVGASFLQHFVVLSGVSRGMAEWILGLQLAPLAVVGIVLLIMLPLGMFLDPMSIILIVIPLAYPVVVGELGFSGVWFGILVVMMIEIGLITPPVGLNVFVVAGVMKGFVTTAEAFAGAAWFVVIQLLIVTLFFTFPELVTMWLPADIM